LKRKKNSFGKIKLKIEEQSNSTSALKFKPQIRNIQNPHRDLSKHYESILSPTISKPKGVISGEILF
jgi:hypothetical protein